MVTDEVELDTQPHIPRIDCQMCPSEEQLLSMTRVHVAAYSIKQVHWRAKGNRDHLQCLTFEMRDGALSPPKGFYKTNYFEYGTTC
jgi:hypothetical protein